MTDLFISQPDFLVTFVVFVLSITLHEAAHAWATTRFGDTDAKESGRLTLNPIAHFEATGIITFLLLGFGWGKPVPTSGNLSKLDTVKVALIGPVTHLVLAFFFGILTAVNILLINRGIYTFTAYSWIFSLGFSLNITLMCVNLIPLPPLDASHILEMLLPKEKAQTFFRFAPYALLALLLFQVVTGNLFLLTPFFTFVYTVGNSLLHGILALFSIGF
ncbi:MAG: site-2 protease family protein [Patescibacteria group bacterium]